MALTKPIIVIKAGRTEAAAKAAASHTGSLTGSDEVLDAAFRRGGVLRVDTIAELFDMAEVLAQAAAAAGPAPDDRHQRRRPGVLATDALIAGGGELAAARPADDGRARTSSCPPHWSHGNPDRHPRRRRRRSATRKALEIAAKDPNSDGLLVILTPQAMTDPTETAEALKPYAQARRQAGARELDGRHRRAGRRGRS